MHLAAHQSYGDQVEKHDAKLEELEARHIFFPPQILLVLRTHCCYHIVRIHHNMHKRIQEADQNSLFT